MKWYIALGAASIGLGIAFFAYLGFTEQKRMAEFTQAFHARQIENGAGLFASACAPCHGETGKGSARAPALNAGDLFNGTRLQSIAWPGTLEDYLRLTISAGRPKPSVGAETYPERMPTWGQQYGGPLRKDQIEALVAFIMNWEERALAEAPIVTLEPDQMVGTDITRQLPEGDAERGEALASGPLGCTACHTLSDLGPRWAQSREEPGIGTRAESRFRENGYTGSATTATQYLFESIVLPNAHLVGDFQPDLMPGNFAQRMTPQDTADLIAHLLTLR